MDDVPTLTAAELGALLARAEEHVDYLRRTGLRLDFHFDWTTALVSVCRQALSQVAEIERLNLEAGQLRSLCLQLEIARDERDAYRADLDEIGRLIGCGHLEDGLARCVRDALEKAKEIPCP
jgi:hypothetical protein